MVVVVALATAAELVVAVTKAVIAVTDALADVAAAV